MKKYITIPAERRERNPLITAAGYRNLLRILEHPDAPRWNYVVGDRLAKTDLPAVEAYRETFLRTNREQGNSPSSAIQEWVAAMRPRSRIFRERLPQGFDLARDWTLIPTMTREDLAVRPEDIVPDDADLARLIVYDTSGTTGHALVVPHHPAAIAMNHALAEFALARRGVRPEFGPKMTACINVCAQRYTVAFANVFAVWGGAGFAKVNLAPNDWREPAAARRFFASLAPAFLTGDPVSFAEMMKWEIAAKPGALISTAVELGAGLKRELGSYFGAPVIDWYSATETGPLAYSCAHDEGLHLMAPDVYVETVDDEGDPAGAGAIGEIAVTGGRNPYLPLLRYRTGDFARLDFTACPCGDPAPRLMDLQGRARVFFRADDGSVVNPADVGRVLRGRVFIQHEFVERADGSFDLGLRPAPGVPLDAAAVEAGLRDLLGAKAVIRVRIEERLGEEGKVIPYWSERVENG